MDDCRNQRGRPLRTWRTRPKGGIGTGMGLCHGSHFFLTLRRTCCAVALKSALRNFQRHHILQPSVKPRDAEKKAEQTFRAFKYRIDSIVLAEGNEKVVRPSGFLAAVPRGNPTYAGQHTPMDGGLMRLFSGRRGTICLLADTPRSTQGKSTLGGLSRDEIGAHSRIAVRYKAAGATIADFGGSMP
jgi:hypothetical protein